MAVSRFADPKLRGALIERFAMGLSVHDAAVACDISEKTVKTWLTKGRKEEKGAYRDFVNDVDEARAQAAERPEPLTEDEHAVLVAEAARKGSVAALKLAWEMICANRSEDEEQAPPASPLDELDELARQRERRAVGA